MTDTLHSVPQLVAYALFDLDPRVRQAQRPLHSFLVSLALFERDTPIREDDLRAEIAAMLPNGAALSNEDVAEALELNVRLKLVIRSDEGELVLSELRRRQLETAQERIESERRSFYAHLASEAAARGAVLSEEDQRRLYELLEARLQEILHSQTSTVAAAWASGGAGFDSAIQDLNAREHLTEVANALAPGGARANKLRRVALAMALEDALRCLPAEAAAYLAALYQRTVAFSLLRQDPTIRRVKQQLAGQRVAYLDANVLIAAMFAADNEHTLANEVLNITRSLSAELRVTSFAVGELRRRVAEASRWMTRYRGDASLRAVVDDVVVRSYQQATREVPNLRWGAFIGGFEPPEAWFAERGIVVEQESDCDNTAGDERLDDVRSAISRNRPNASSGVVETDALNILHVVRRRQLEGPDEMGNRVWLVTLDRSLARAERTLVEAGTLTTGASRLARVWVDLLSLCLPPDDAALSSYVAHLVESQFSLLAEDPMFVNKDFLLTLSSSRFNVSDVLGASPERARQVLIRMQEDEELAGLLGDPKLDEEEWNTQLEDALRRVLASIEQSPDQLAELREHREARLMAEQQAQEERRGRLQSLRELADIRAVADEATTLAHRAQDDALEARAEAARVKRERDDLKNKLDAERSKPLWRRILRR